MKRIDRITEMEKCLDLCTEANAKFAAALDEFEASRAAYEKLYGYYFSGTWRRDLEADEAGRLPEDLKRGVLSEDAVYDLITDNRDLVLRLVRLTAECVEKELK